MKTVLYSGDINYVLLYCLKTSLYTESSYKKSPELVIYNHGIVYSAKVVLLDQTEVSESVYMGIEFV